jgi:CheY-like chemotaxis protein
MITEYLNEIIAFIAIVVALAIYLFVKRAKGSSAETKEQFIQDIETLESKKANALDVELSDETLYDAQDEALEKELIEELSGSVEGDFGVEETPHASTPIVAKKEITKRSVPQHSKITKQHFKEFAGSRILVAEDNLINQKVLAGLLADSGIELVMANDGKEALDILLKDQNFLMVLMDAHMPRIDGFEATRSIRANPNYEHIVVVALSGDTAADDIKKMHAAGMSEHLEKPLRMDALYDIIYAYSGNDESEDSEYVDIIMTTELNGDKGLSICGGDEKFYMEILNEFISTYSHSADQLSDLLQSENFKEADKLLLDIIGISANIGADPLNETANNLKDALKDTTEKSYLTLLEEYHSHLEALLRDIKEFKAL